MANSGESNFLETFGKIGGLFGLFVFIQAFGYLSGAGSISKYPSSVYEAVHYGIAHLRHFFQPFSKTAWPLSPTLCGLMLLYVTHLPNQLRREEQTLHSEVNGYFFSLLLAVSLITSGAVLSHNSYQLSLTLFKWANTPALILTKKIIYLFSVLAITYLIHNFSCLKKGFVLKKPLNESPWPELMTALIFVWLMLITYSGSFFDGQLDQCKQLILQP